MRGWLNVVSSSRTEKNDDTNAINIDNKIDNWNKARTKAIVAPSASR